MNKILHADNLRALGDFADESFALVYIDPPFNSGTRQTRKRLRTRRAASGEDGDRSGFQGRRYTSVTLGESGFDDKFADFPAFLRPRLIEARRVLKPNGSFFLHLDFREVHYCKVLADEIFGRESFMNEIIWAYDYGARSRKKWPAKHDNILWYAKNPRDYVFNYAAMERIPYLAPKLVGKEKAARGKTPTDVWWHTIVSPTGKEKTGYATQKPLALLERLIKVHTNPGDNVLDFFAGSGTTGEAAARHNRNFVLVDHSPAAVKVMHKRLSAWL